MIPLRRARKHGRFCILMREHSAISRMLLGDFTGQRELRALSKDDAAERDDLMSDWHAFNAMI